MRSEKPSQTLGYCVKLALNRPLTVYDCQANRQRARGPVVQSLLDLLHLVAPLFSLWIKPQCLQFSPDSAQAFICSAGIEPELIRCKASALLACTITWTLHLCFFPCEEMWWRDGGEEERISDWFFDSYFLSLFMCLSFAFFWPILGSA